MNRVKITHIYTLAMCLSFLLCGLQANSVDMPEVVMNETGYKVKAWEETVEGKNVIHISTRSASDTAWNDTISLSDHTVNSYQPNVGIDSSNNIVVIWAQQDTQHQILTLYATLFSSSTSTWFAPIALSSNDENVFKTYKLSVNSNGEVIVAWNSYLLSQEKNAAFTSVYTPGGSWSTSQI